MIPRNTMKVTLGPSRTISDLYCYALIKWMRARISSAFLYMEPVGLARIPNYTFPCQDPNQTLDSTCLSTQEKNRRREDGLELSHETAQLLCARQEMFVALFLFHLLLQLGLLRPPAFTYFHRMTPTSIPCCMPMLTWIDHC